MVVVGEVAVYDRVNIGMAEREGLVVGGESDYGDLGAAENTQLAGFLEKTGAAFGEGDLSCVLVL